MSCFRREREEIPHGLVLALLPPSLHNIATTSHDKQSVPPTSTDLSVFLRILRTNYGQKVKNTDAKSAPEGAASITVSGGLERYTEISRKIRRLRSLPVKLTWRYCKQTALKHERPSLKRYSLST